MQISGFRGELITADHADYDTTRAVWNGAVDPAAPADRPMQRDRRRGRRRVLCPRP